ncbi:HNH endonuclease signature motif containing protein [Rhodococcus opacus]|uniref:HNH endonuclease signature motif containing protein n=1 Tax=Rhodococcus opacus TaxID=37919 RepID=UPI000EA95C94|nr:HNH endonuclease signature motif containing protein [Rhodococcus opacus]QZS54692.1 HNH endonuclease [Rhodococcus opacus]RKM72229.1 HNH endonuclease [Rhodococcus opacus]
MGLGGDIQGALSDEILATAVGDAWRLAETKLLESVVHISEEIQRLEALRVKLVGAVDHRCKVDVLGFPNAKMWLASKTLLEVGAAGRIVMLGRGLRQQPEIADEYFDTNISAEHTALIMKFCERPPKGMPLEAMEDCRNALLFAATGPTANTDAVRAVIDRLERTFESDDPSPSEDTELNEFHASKTLNGRIAVKGDLDAVTGEMLLSALSGLSKPRPAQDGTKDSRTPGQRRADGFTELLRRYLNSGIAGEEGGERPHVSLHVNARDLADHADSRARARQDAAASSDGTLFAVDGVAWTEWMGPLSIEAARLLACDSIYTPIVLDDKGAPLDLGIATRTVTKRQRKALVARDRGCAFPGCGAPPSWCEGHHIVHWSAGGPSDMDNLVLLCGFHHRLLHHSDWEIEMGADRHPTFIPPRQVDWERKPIPAHNRGRPRAS